MNMRTGNHNLHIKWLTGHSGGGCVRFHPHLFYERNQMGLIVESAEGNVSGEARSQSFQIRDDIGGEVEFDWEEWDALSEVINQLELQKP